MKTFFQINSMINVKINGKLTFFWIKQLSLFPNPNLKIVKLQTKKTLISSCTYILNIIIIKSITFQKILND